jgi:hypothetical protein
MTLNDNPMVSAEKRRKLLLLRRSKLIAYSSRRISIEYENGIAARMYIDPYIKSGKASKLINRINKEVGVLDKFLTHFK